MHWDSLEIRRLVQSALQEDAARQDVTTRTLIPSSLRIEALLVSKQAGVICGLPLAAAMFKALDSRCAFLFKVREGAHVKAKTALAILRGSARAILSAERPALNALQHLSGIATFTHDQVRRLRPGKTLLYDTRKTLPGWRSLQKYAVLCGGGMNHRASLADAVLIKDNHLKVCRLVHTDWITSIHRFRRKGNFLPIEMEIQTPQDLRDALRLAPQWILLDNMPIARLRPLIKQLRRRLPGIRLEISGGVRPEQLKPLGRLDVERISMGRLTHSAPALDCSLEIVRVIHPR